MNEQNSWMDSVKLNHRFGVNKNYGWSMSIDGIDAYNGSLEKAINLAFKQSFIGDRLSREKVAYICSKNGYFSGDSIVIYAICDKKYSTDIIQD